MKTANVFLSDNGKTIKLGDLNVSKVVGNQFASTQTGTPYYASPEVWRDESYSTKTDIWSLGCVIYEMCMLRPPFSALNMDELYTKVQKCKILPFDSNYSSELKHLILKMMSLDFKQRPSCEDILKSKIFSSLRKKYRVYFQSRQT